MCACGTRQTDIDNEGKLKWKDYVLVMSVMITLSGSMFHNQSPGLVKMLSPHFLTFHSWIVVSLLYMAPVGVDGSGTRAFNKPCY